MQPCCWLSRSTVRVEIFELCCTQARTGVVYTHYLSFACCRGGATPLTAHREHEAHAVLHEANTRLPLLPKSAGRVHRRMGRSFHSPKTRSQRRRRSRTTALIGLVRERCLPVRLCAARQCSAAAARLQRSAIKRRRSTWMSRFQAQSAASASVKVDRVHASLRRRLRVVSRRAVNFAQRCKGRRVILLGLPGAFTPT